MSSSRRPCAVCNSMETECKEGCVFASHLSTEHYYEKLRRIEKCYSIDYVAMTLKNTPKEQWEDLLHDLACAAEFQKKYPISGLRGALSKLRWDIEALKGKIACFNQPPPQLSSPRPPCAVCTFIGAECRVGCVFAPHFPAKDFQQRFHLIKECYPPDFILKTLKETPEEQWEEVVNDLAGAAEFRRDYSTSDIQRVVSEFESDIAYLKGQIARFRPQQPQR